MLTKQQRWKIAWLVETTNLSNRAIAKVVKCSHQTVGDTKNLLIQHELNSDDIEKTTSHDLNVLLFPNYPYRNTDKVQPDFKALENAMCKDNTYTIYKGWTVYKAQNKGKNVLEISQYCARFRLYRKASGLSYRKDEKPGEIAYIDYAGKKARVYSFKLTTGESAYIFVSNIGRSQRLFFYSTPGQTTKDWLEAQEDMFEYHGGVPDIVVPDNATALVNKATTPKILQANYEEFGKHYRVTILPTRRAKPKDKGVVEGTNTFMYARVLSDIREMKFFSFKELNKYLREKSDELNDMTFQKFSVSRNDLFVQYDKPALGPLPKTKYPYIEKVQRLNTRNEYEVIVDEHIYGVPYKYRNKDVEVHLTKDEVLIYHDMILIKKHKRSFEVKGITRNFEDLHPHHQWFTDKSLEHFWLWAEQFGPAAQKLMAIQFECKRDKSHVANNACRAIQKHYKDFDLSSEIFEQVCQFAITYQQTKPSYIYNILKNKIYMDDEVLQILPQIEHKNLRGSNYFTMNKGERHDNH